MKWKVMTKEEGSIEEEQMIGKIGLTLLCFIPFFPFLDIVLALHSGHHNNIW